MSNPAVITLVNLRRIGANLNRLDIEDNIGEGIHIHINNLRIDMTVNEFLSLADQLEVCLKKLNPYMKIDLSKFDPHFLYRIGNLFSDICKMEIEEYPLSDLVCLVYVDIPKIGRVVVPKLIKKTPAYLYLTGKCNSFVNYEQDFYPDLNNLKRLHQLVESIKTNGYPHCEKYITLFGSQPYIRDGQHRAAALAAIRGSDQRIPVLVIHFKGERWRFHPRCNILKTVVRNLFRKAFRNIDRRIFGYRT